MANKENNARRHPTYTHGPKPVPTAAAERDKRLPEPATGFSRAELRQIILEMIG